MARLNYDCAISTASASKVSPYTRTHGRKPKRNSLGQGDKIRDTLLLGVVLILSNECDRRFQAGR